MAFTLVHWHFYYQLQTQGEHSSSTQTGLRSGIEPSSSNSHATTIDTFSHATLPHATLHPPLNLLYFHSAASPSRRSRARLIIINQWTKILAAPASVKCPSPPALSLSLSRYHAGMCQRVSLLTCLLTLLLCSGKAEGIEAVGCCR